MERGLFLCIVWPPAQVDVWLFFRGKFKSLLHTILKKCNSIVTFMYIKRLDGAYVLSKLEAIAKNGFSQKAVVRLFWSL